MRVSLVYPCEKAASNGCNPPISLLYLAASLINAGHEVRVIDRDEDNKSLKDIVHELVEYSPRLVGIPLFSPFLKEPYQLVNLLNETGKDWDICLGGPHATVRPEYCLKVFKGARFVIRGEGEEGIVKLANAIENDGNLSDIKGLSFLDGDTIIHNPDSEPIKDIDSIPLPARDILSSAYKKGTYWRLGHKGITDIIISSRGCPYSCNFCFKVTKGFRMRSPENILKELLELKSKGIRCVHFLDDLFVSNKNRCLKILQLIREERLNLEFKVRSRVNTIDEELLEALKETGAKSIVYGIESGSQQILDAMNKKTTVEMNYRAVELTKRYGLQCYADIFLGYLGETIDTIKETEEWIMKAKPTAINLGILYPLPETVVYEDARKQGVLINDWTVDGPDPWVKLPWINSRDDIAVHYDRIMRRYLRNPTVIWNGVWAVLPGIDFKQVKVLLNYLYNHIK